jgi:hypothetical protein
MPVISSQITEDSIQADSRRWVTEEHIDSTVETHQIIYLAEFGADITTTMNNRVSQIDENLFDEEINFYLNRIEQGKNVIDLDYTETTQSERAIKFLKWAKAKALAGDHQALRYACLIIDEYTEVQIDNLLGAGKGAKVKTWAEKIRAMAISMNESEVAAGDI